MCVQIDSRVDSLAPWKESLRKVWKGSKAGFQGNCRPAAGLAQRGKRGKFNGGHNRGRRKGGKNGSKFSARGMPTISPTDRPALPSCLLRPALVRLRHKMPRKAALFRQTGFSSFAKTGFSRMRNFYAAIAQSPASQKSQNWGELRQNLPRKNLHRNWSRFHAAEYLLWCSLSHIHYTIATF